MATVKAPVIRLGAGASLGGAQLFSSDSPWNRDVSADPIDPRSAELTALLGHDEYSLGSVVGLHPEFGSGLWKGARIGLPYQVVSEAQPFAPVVAITYPLESDHGPMPIPPTVVVEGMGSTRSGIDRHVIVLQRDASRPNGLGRLYELYAAEKTTVLYKARSRTVWACANAAVWDLNGPGWGERPLGWTSADAAGLPIFPGLVRYDEVASGEIRHALRFTATHTRKAFVPPATHYASWFTADNPPGPSIVSLLGCAAAEAADRLPPMGMRVRLRASFDVAPFPKTVQVILRCLQRYGMILADNGGGLFITGSPDPRWNDDELATMGEVKAGDLEVVQMGTATAEV